MAIDCYIDTKELAARWRKSPVTLKQWRWKNYGPRWTTVPPRRVLYPLSAVIAWEQANELDPH